jgi:hypothetical protein
MNEWFLCVDCERCYKVSEIRITKIKDDLTGLFHTIELCPYEDCNGSPEVTYEAYDEDAEISSWSGGWSWREVLEAIPEYPRIPERGRVYRIYPECPPHPIYPFLNRLGSTIRVTVDTNELFNIHNGTGDSVGLNRLMELHSEGNIRICIPAIAASENRSGGVKLENYAEFEEFVASLGLTDYEELSPILLLDEGYLGYGLAYTPVMMRLARRIHHILSPSIEFDYEDYVARLGEFFTSRHYRKWLNVTCDVMAMWSHIHHRADFFVTEDQNFHKRTKKPRLLELGARQICTPSECVSELTRFGYA